MADLSAIDKYFDQVVRGLPTSDLKELEDSDPIMDSLKVSFNKDDSMSPLSNDEYAKFKAANPQLNKQEPVVISGEPAKSPYSIEAEAYPQNKFPAKAAESLRQNVNAVLPEMERNVEQRKSNLNDLRSQIKGREAMGEKALQDLQDSLPAYKPTMDYAGEAAKLREQSDAIKDPQKDLLTQAILSFGPAVAGMFTGENGALAAPVAQQNAQNTYDKELNSIRANNALLRKGISDRIAALAKAEQNDINRYTETQKLALEKAKAVAQNSINQVRYGKEDLVQQNAGLNEAVKSLNEAFGKGAEKASDLQQKEESSIRSAQAMKSRTDAIDSRIKDTLDERQMNRIQDALPKHPVVVNVMKARTALNQAMSLLEDPNVAKSPQVLSDAVQGIIAAVNTQRQSTGAERHDKMINSGLQGDLQKFANYLSSRQDEVPQSTLNEIKTTLKSMHDSEERVYAATMDEALNSIAGINSRPLFQRHPEYKDMMKNYIDGLSGIGAKTPEAPSKHESLPQTKTINGDTYKKVQGGWEKVK